jgi:hypothetical protein
MDDRPDYDDLRRALTEGRDRGMRWVVNDLTCPGTLPITLACLFLLRRGLSDERISLVLLCEHREAPRRAIQIAKENGFESLSIEQLYSMLAARG